MTELTFLVELLLNHKLQKSTKDLIASRLKEVEGEIGQRPVQARQVPVPPVLVGQAPSTIAAMMRHGITPQETGNIVIDEPQKSYEIPAAAVPVAIVAQNPATMAAINSRNQAIAESIAGKVDKVSGRPRKF